MNAQKPALARALVMTLFAGILFWSSWSLQASRMPPPAGTIPYFQYKAFNQALGVPAMPKRQWKNLPVAAKRTQSQQSRLLMSQRLTRVAKDPAQIKTADLDAVRAAWGPEASRMLSLLKPASN